MPVADDASEAVLATLFSKAIPETSLKRVNGCLLFSLTIRFNSTRELIGNALRSASLTAASLTWSTQEIFDAEEFIQKALPLLHSEEAKQEYRKLLQELKLIDKDYQQLDEKVNQIISLGISGNIDEMLKQAKSVEGLEDDIDNHLVAILDEIQLFTLNAAVTAEEHKKAQGFPRAFLRLIT